MKRWLCPRTKMLTYLLRLSLLSPGSLSVSVCRNRMIFGLKILFEVTSSRQIWLNDFRIRGVFLFTEQSRKRGDSWYAGWGCVSRGLMGILRCLLFCSGFYWKFYPLVFLKGSKTTSSLQRCAPIGSCLSGTGNSFRSLSRFHTADVLHGELNDKNSQ